MRAMSDVFDGLTQKKAGRNIPPAGSYFRGV